MAGKKGFRPHMHRLSVASAKHLLSMGLMGQKQHDSIVKRSQPHLPSAPGAMDHDGDEAGEQFGSLGAVGGGPSAGPSPMPGMLAGANQDWKA